MNKSTKLLNMKRQSLQTTINSNVKLLNMKLSYRYQINVVGGTF